MAFSPFTVSVKPDGDAFISCVKREGTPKRTHFAELFLDAEVETAIGKRFDLFNAIDSSDPFAQYKKQIATQRFLGYDYVKVGVEKLGFTFERLTVDDGSELKKAGGKRTFAEEHIGPVTNWEEFEKYQWPDLSKAETKALEWFDRNLPDDMVIMGGLTGHIAEEITWLMGYETLCYAFYENRELVKAIYDKVLALSMHYVDILLQFPRVKIVWASDDMGFKTQPMFSPKEFKEFVLPAHKILAEKTHSKNRLYFLHACGKIDLLMDDLIHDVGIDAKHSFEDTIEDVSTAKANYGKHISLLGGIDVDFLCRADEASIRRRVRDTLDKCHSGGGYCLGTGNSVANYISIDNYLAMLDEGRKLMC